MKLRTVALSLATYSVALSGCSHRAEHSTRQSLEGASKAAIFKTAKSQGDMLAEKRANNELAPLNWQFQYDDDGHPLRAVAPGRAETSYQYERDESGSVKNLIATLCDGSMVHTEFDSLGRRASMRDTGGTGRYKYDAMGRPSAIEREGAL